MAAHIPSSMLLELGQAFSSMPELDPVLLSSLSQIQNIVASEGAALWLLNEAEVDIICTHATGADASKIMGSVMRARKFVAAYRTSTGRLTQTEDPLQSKWMDSRAYRTYFNISVRNMIGIPLVSRGKLLGEINIINKAGETAFTHNDYDFIHEVTQHIALAIQNTQLYERNNRTTGRQKLLNQISRHLHQTLDIDELIPRIFIEVNKAINAEAQSIWLVDEEAGVIRCRFARGASAETLKGLSVPLNAPSIVGTSVSKQESIIIKDAQNDPRHARSVDERTGFVTRSLMTVPLVLEDKSIGAIQAVNKRDGQLFTRDDLDLFRSIADSAALAVNNAQLVADLQTSYDLTLDALSAALDLRDRETEGHSRRVVEYTTCLAQQIGLDKESIKNIRRGALIHDIGKIGVPDAVLHKPGSLDETERNIINLHPLAGYNMLAGIPYLREEIQIVICHQEKWDGTGYPHGLRGEEIPIGARLFAIADTFDALTSDRPYRLGCSYETARGIIIEESGRQFDPRAVEAFLAIPEHEWMHIRAKVMEEIAHRRSLQKRVF
ncbi:MAG TPA: GAF domain-containing protein [Anaerolineales bacterium]|nr:GAF domain-containing protein [Anaerolineales bacterium]HND90781.1 GAF domain-containing protein [Anaerolineales bacterium]HNJ12624.1 GAF domain-containing protein [Anaerolineales bacterium]